MASSRTLRSAAAPTTPTTSSFGVAGGDDSIDYDGPVTRSVARRRTGATPAPEVPAVRRRTTRRRVAKDSDNTHTRSSSDSSVDSTSDLNSHENPSTASSSTSSSDQKHLKVDTKAPATSGSSYPPSPLGLIPIHQKWHAIIHKHEVPRKLLHVSIGFFSLALYVSGTQPTAVTPWLMVGLVPIALTDVLRHNVPSFNKFYVKILGALMRESEYQGYNGVIFYLLGAWTVLNFFPKDIGLLGVMLLSWCDCAASTIGRAYGKYTPQVRRGKSLAGSLAAMLTGVATALYFWGYLAPRIGYQAGDEDFPFMFTGRLSLPGVVESALGLKEGTAVVEGGWALGIVSLFTGVIASASEVVDLFGWDDNLTIPVLSGAGIWAFLKVFG